MGIIKRALSLFAATNVRNGYNEMEVKFHKEARFVGQHGRIVVSHIAQRLDQVDVPYVLPGLQDAPVFDERFVQDLVSSAKSQGYIVHHILPHKHGKLAPYNDDWNELVSDIIDEINDGDVLSEETTNRFHALTSKPAMAPQESNPLNNNPAAVANRNAWLLFGQSTAEETVKRAEWAVDIWLETKNTRGAGDLSWRQCISTDIWNSLRGILVHEALSKLITGATSAEMSHSLDCHAEWYFDRIDLLNAQTEQAINTWFSTFAAPNVTWNQMFFGGRDRRWPKERLRACAFAGIESGVPPEIIQINLDRIAHEYMKEKNIPLTPTDPVDPVATEKDGSLAEVGSVALTFPRNPGQPDPDVVGHNGEGQIGSLGL